MATDPWSHHPPHERKHRGHVDDEYPPQRLRILLLIYLGQQLGQGEEVVGNLRQLHVLHVDHPGYRLHDALQLVGLRLENMNEYVMLEGKG